MTYGGELHERTFRPGDTIHLPAKAIHRVTADLALPPRQARRRKAGLIRFDYVVAAPPPKR